MKDLEGFDEMLKGMEHLIRELPKEGLQRAVKKGAEVVRKQIKKEAPRKTGALRGGLIIRKEKNRTAGKVVYGICPDPKKNTTFQKPIKEPVRSGSEHAYYPSSQEYGFFTRRPDGGMRYINSKGNAERMDKVPGKHYMRAGAEASGEEAKSVIAEAILNEIEKGLGG